MSRFSSFVTLLLVVLAARCADAGYLVKDGQPQADIIIAEKPPRAVKLAAAELQTYIEKITGAKIPVLTVPGTNVSAHIYVGRSEHTDKLNISDEGLKYGAFRMVSGKNWLVLLGHDANYVLPAYVYRSHADVQSALKAWDERTGEHWNNPFSTERLYRQYNALIDVSIYDERGSLNAVYEYLRGLGVRWYMPGELGEIVPSMKTIKLKSVDKTVRPDFGYRNLGDYSPTFDCGTRDEVLYKLRLGLEPGTGIPGPHGLNNIDGRDEVKKAHPEFYSNHRSPASNDLYFASCLSSPELFATTVKYARAVFDIYPGQEYISIWPNDGFYGGNMCRCDLCKDRRTPNRGASGDLSDYVWDFVNRVAQELYKTHPERKIICGAYGAYTLPPEKIAKFSPNVMVGIVEKRLQFNNPEVRALALQIRKEYLDRLAPGNLCTYNHYLASRNRVPAYCPHVIAEDLRSLKGLSQGEYIELTQGTGARGMHAPGFNHLNVYVTARYYWDANQDIDVLLQEYYEKFYGPAAKQMRSFIEFSEANWQRMTKEATAAERGLELLAAAQQAAGDTVYGKRVALVTDYLRPLKDLQKQLAMGRGPVPEARVLERDMKDIKLDGQLDETFWQVPWSHTLVETETGKRASWRTTFKTAYAGGNLYFGITCEGADTNSLVNTTTHHDDMAVFEGESVEILLETSSHSYYQLAISPAGGLLDADWKKGSPDTLWSSGAEVATRISGKSWSAEIRIPIMEPSQEELLPLIGVAGMKPSETYPWYFNVCRHSVGGKGNENSTFSTTGRPGFHVPMKFAKLYVR
jgi:hypothetical protein